MAGREQRALRLLSSFCFASIAGALVLIDRDSPATGYELSIYTSLPAAVWVCLIATLAGGTGIIVHQAFAGRVQTVYDLPHSIIAVGTRPAVHPREEVLEAKLSYGEGAFFVHPGHAWVKHYHAKSFLFYSSILLLTYILWTF